MQPFHKRKAALNHGPHPRTAVRGFQGACWWCAGGVLVLVGGVSGCVHGALYLDTLRSRSRRLAMSRCSRTVAPRTLPSNRAMTAFNSAVGLGTDALAPRGPSAGAPLTIAAWITASVSLRSRSRSATIFSARDASSLRKLRSHDPDALSDLRLQGHDARTRCKDTMQGHGATTRGTRDTHACWGDKEKKT